MVDTRTARLDEGIIGDQSRRSITRFRPTSSALSRDRKIWQTDYRTPHQQAVSSFPAIPSAFGLATSTPTCSYRPRILATDLECCPTMQD